jgi:hypothetical protein
LRLVRSVPGCGSMSLVSVSSGHAEGTNTLQLLVTLCVQNPHEASRTVHSRG